MGMKEKRREKKTKTKGQVRPIEVEEPKSQKIGETLAVQPSEDTTSGHVDEIVEIKSHTETVAKSEIVTEPEIILPSWGDITESEWMYSIPPRKEDSTMWAEEWGDFLLEWAQSKSVHVISLSTFLKEIPFKDMVRKVDAFRLIGDCLVKKEVADWLDRGRRQLRIYWKPLEEWADILYEWALQTGNTFLDLKSIIIQEADEEFAKLPERDIGILLSMLVEKGSAEWIDKKKFAIKIQF